MADPIEELYTRWKESPKDAAATLALCDALRGSGRDPIIQLVGEVAIRDQPENIAVLIATARMYMEAQRLQDAQTVLVSAGKIAPRDGGVYRWLGEVLLRRGDADRAEKVFERAIQFGATDTDTRLWIERAKVFRPMQAKSGSRAVAAEVAKSAGLASSLPIAKLSGDEPEEARTSQFAAGKPQPPSNRVKMGSLNENSEVFLSPDRPPTPFEQKTAQAFVPYVKEQIDTKDGAIIGDDETTLARPSPLSMQRPLDMTAPPPKAQPPPMKLPGGRLAPPGPGGRAGGAGGAMSGGGAASGPAAPPFGVQIVTGNAQTTGSSPTAPAFASMQASLPPLQPSSSRPPPPLRPPVDLGPALPPYVPPPNVPTTAPTASPFSYGVDASVPVKKRTPDPRDVLDALQLAGIFEPEGAQAAAPAWDRGEKRPRRLKNTISLVLMTCALAGGGWGIYRYIGDSRAKQHDLAEQILVKVEADLHAARPGALGTTEQQIGRAFDLDSRSPRAAVDWLHERALLGLMKGGADVAFEDAITRAREVKVPEDHVAFALLASFLFQGDTAGAAALMPKWDGPSANDPWYQLVAGATLERAGAPRAAERYAAAAKLDPQLLVAEAMLARAVAIDGDAQKAGDLARAFRQKYPDRAEGVALVALAWGRDASRGSDEPTEVADTIAHAAELPASLAFVPHAVLALRAIDKHAPADAKAHVEKGLAVADGPGVASWLGSIAIDSGDEQLARKAALTAVGFSALYAPARVLAARVALLGDRLDEAMKATEELDAASPDVAVVRAAVAYEKVDADGLERAFKALPDDVRKLPFLAPLGYSNDVLFGRLQLAPEKLVGISDDEAPWSDLLAMDMALDAGDLDSAQKIAASWKGSERRPLRALRLARLSRYTARLDDADALSEVAITQGTVTVRSLAERVYVLVARGKSSEVGPLLAKYPLVLGQALTTWLNAYATAAGGKVDDARGKIAQLDPLPTTSPLPVRTICAMAFGATRDRRRGGEYVKTILGPGLGNPDLGAAAMALGGHKTERPGKPTLYQGP